VTVALFTDQNLNGAIVRGLRRRDIDVLTAEDDGSDRRRDPDLLDRAFQLGRVLVTHDQDFFREAYLRQVSGVTFAGIIFVPDRLAIGRAINDIEILAQAGHDTEFRNVLYRLPL
jgi:hypothetical protein